VEILGERIISQKTKRLIMKILLVHMGLMSSTVEELSSTSDDKIIWANYYRDATRIIKRGVDGVITNLVMRQRYATGYGEAPTLPWGLALAAQATADNIPLIIITDGWNSREKEAWVVQCFKQFSKTPPEIILLYGGGNKKKQREIYLKLKQKIEKNRKALVDKPQEGL
jgi:hypothetical protein